MLGLLLLGSTAGARSTKAVYEPLARSEAETWKAEHCERSLKVRRALDHFLEQATAPHARASVSLTLSRTL